MSNSNIKSRGFTIVELLIVIVVIAILATISIVAYNGIQNRGKQSAAQALASQISKKAEAFNTTESAYPTYSQFTTNSGDGTAGNPAEAKLDNTAAVIATTPTDEKVVQYTQCPASPATPTGARITYRTFPTGTTFMRVGTGC